MLDLLFIVPVLGVLGLLAADEVLSWWQRWLGYGLCLLFGGAVAGRDQIATLGPFEIVVTVVMCALISLLWVGGRWVTEALMRRFR